MMARWFEPAEALSDADVGRSMRLVLSDGLTTQVMGTLTGGVFLTAYALHAGASNMLVGLLAAIPFLAQLAQLPAILLVERLRRRRLVVVVSSGLGRLALLAAGFGVLLPPGPALALLICGLLLHAGFGAVSGCGWNSWMRDLMPVDRLGSFFGRRLFHMTLLGAVLSYGAGLAVDARLAQAPGSESEVYSLLFVAGAAAGLAGVGLLALTPEPRMPPRVAREPLRRLLAEPFRDANFRRLMLFLGSWSFAVNLASPFFTVYMLTRLGMGMAEVMPLVVFSQFVNMGFLRLWGRLSDGYGNKPVLALCGPLYILCFLGWTFTTLPEPHGLTLPLLYLLHALMGIATAGVTLASANIALKLSPQGKATAYLAMNGVISSLAAGIAPIVGGAFADFFAARELSLAVRWSAPGQALSFDALSLQHWDFFFLMACAIGFYSLHRLSLVREVGEATNRTLLRQVLVEARRGIYNVSSAAGLRWLAGIPAAELMRSRPPARRDAPAGNDDARPAALHSA
ncbi:MFS transporter [Arenibaculum sp.]|uniref:MFS transporter n=1 Tax=Arenibaculum sp. TaxID=2865862 RepID=UPI002E139F15|nr:MFS transporter [Arenibaculum sp.]